MQQLNKKIIDSKDFFVREYPERIIQFGEGNFLRGFVDWMVHQANKAGVFQGSVVVVQPIPEGLVDQLNEQEGLFTLVLRSQRNGEEVVEKELISSIRRGIRSHDQWEQVLACAEDSAIDIMVSNTTEAGIAYVQNENFNPNQAPRSFPGKVCSYLYHRYTTLAGDPNKGMLILPCELIDRNGDKLKEVVSRYAREWKLGSRFLTWLDQANVFANTLVDRIVTGYPGKSGADKLSKTLGYRDTLLNTGESFHMWVIEAPAESKKRFPLHQAGLNIKWVDDISCYRTQKVRILNGAHTSTVALAYLSGYDFVRPAIEDPKIARFLNSVLFGEIIPTLAIDHEMATGFAEQVIERFKNPFIQHRWLDISLNSVSKFKARVLPSLLAHLDNGITPELLTFSFAALICFYKGQRSPAGYVGHRDGDQYPIKDDPAIIEFFGGLWESSQDYRVLTQTVLSNTAFWGTDLSKYCNLKNLMADYLAMILNQGVHKALQQAMIRKTRQQIIKIHPADNVGVAVAHLPKGITIDISGTTISLTEEIPAGHKVALQYISEGRDVVKYGSPIGHASADIEAGDWVHTHNTKTNLSGELTYRYSPTDTDLRQGSSQDLHFSGYLRNDGQVGIRNEIWIIPTVGCTNHTATLIAMAAMQKIGTQPWSTTIDGVFELKHPYGCSQLGADHTNTQKLLASLVHHPNAAGVVVLGLGCENNQVQQLKQAIGPYDEERVAFLVAQEVGDEIEIGTELVCELARRASKHQRQELPISQLKIGLKCGGSDGLSGITANPLVGRISDIIVQSGGTSILTEVPEMFGAEHLLMNRAIDKQVFGKVVSLINRFKAYYAAYDQPIYENPSPGNKEGGITTLEDKSLGCTEKGGTSPVVDVLDYAGRTTHSGLNLLCSPGNDIVASTALAAAGCHMVLFTTGRGTPFGTCIPTVKIATNSDLARRKPHWVDFNAGTIVEGESFSTVVAKLLTQMVSIANGEMTKSERMNCREIAIWKNGVTL